MLPSPVGGDSQSSENEDNQSHAECKRIPSPPPQPHQQSYSFDSSSTCQFNDGRLSLPQNGAPAVNSSTAAPAPTAGSVPTHGHQQQQPQIQQQPVHSQRTTPWQHSGESSTGDDNASSRSDSHSNRTGKRRQASAGSGAAAASVGVQSDGGFVFRHIILTQSMKESEKCLDLDAVRKCRGNWGKELTVQCPSCDFCRKISVIPPADQCSASEARIEPEAVRKYIQQHWREHLASNSDRIAAPSSAASPMRRLRSGSM